NSALDQIRAGKMVILVDDEDRENEGDLCLAAEAVTAEAINFMAVHGRGLICLTLEEEQVARLELPMMSAPGRSGPPLGTAFTVSIEARLGGTTRISPPLPAPPPAPPPRGARGPGPPTPPPPGPAGAAPPPGGGGGGPRPPRPASPACAPPA